MHSVSLVFWRYYKVADADMIGLAGAVIDRISNIFGSEGFYTLID